MLVHPVGAGEGSREAGGDAVAGGFNAVFSIEVDFGDDAGHVNTLEVADTARFVVGDHEVWECRGVDFVFADGSLADCLLLNVFNGLIEAYVVLTIALRNDGRCCSRHHCPCDGQRVGRRGWWTREGQLQQE